MFFGKLTAYLNFNIIPPLHKHCRKYNVLEKSYINFWLSISLGSANYKWFFSDYSIFDGGIFHVSSGVHPDALICQIQILFCKKQQKHFRNPVVYITDMVEFQGSNKADS